jgi:prolyl 4-hydroxylase
MQVLVPGANRPFADGGRLDHSAPLVFSLPGVCAPAECADMVARVEQLGFADAPITTATGFVMRPDIRNNTRVMFDDVPLAAQLFARVKHVVPARLCHRRPVGVNERFRCYRYDPGQRFAPHYDGAFVRSDREASELTFMIYLNEGFAGGDTVFLEFGVRETPRTGAALFFQHALLHEGCAVASGRKYVLRSDVMYAAG